jgi:cell division septal protein FtsQ
VVSVVTLLALGAAICFLLSSDLFTVSRVSIIGSHRLSQEQVVEQTALTGRNIFTLNTQQVRMTTAAISPIMQDVTLEYRLPDEVVVTVRERTSFMAWQFGDKLFDVSADGVILGAWEGQEPQSKVITTAHTPAPGDKVDPSVLELVFTLQHDLPATLGLTPKEFHYSESQGIKVVTGNGLEILIGSSDAWAEKLGALAALLEESTANNRQIEFIDIRFKDRPYFR